MLYREISRPPSPHRPSHMNTNQRMCVNACTHIIYHIYLVDTHAFLAGVYMHAAKSDNPWISNVCKSDLFRTFVCGLYV